MNLLSSITLTGDTGSAWCKQPYLPIVSSPPPRHLPFWHPGLQSTESSLDRPSVSPT